MISFMRYLIPDDKKLVYQTTFSMRWGDMDAMGHLNNAMYFRYFETVRIDWLHGIGAKPDPKGEGFVIANAVCNFYKQLAYPSNIVAKLYVSDVARTTFETWVTLELEAEPNIIYAAGGSTTIWIDSVAKKATSLPDWMKVLLMT
jgi:acyl-CoA thioester hydrolase